MDTFVFNSLPTRVLFGPNTLDRLPEEIERLGARRALVLSTPHQLALAEDIAERLGDRSVGVFPHAVMHVPVEIAERARNEAYRLGADCVIAAGGGSTVGLGKAIALHSSLPILAVPTTYAGSEMTPIYGMTELGLKRTGHDARVLPKTVIYQPSLTLDLPVSISVASGFNAIAHAAEALYAKERNPVTSMIAEDGIRALSRGIPVIASDPHHLDGRSECLYGAWLCGTVLGTTGMALHHKLCHVLGGTWNLPHAETHCVILSHVLAFNYTAAPEAMQRIERAMGTTHAASGIYDMMKRLNAPTSLREVGMLRDHLARAASLVTETPYYNPRATTPEEILRLLEDAFEGRRAG